MDLLRTKQSGQEGVGFPARALPRSALAPWWLAATCLLLISAPAGAQIVFDGTLGMRSDGTDLQAGDTPGLIGGILWDIQDHFGEFSGPNLFFSFSEFGIPQSMSAVFSSLNPVESVIARVTGGLASEINGSLISSDIAGADFFLLNPSGVYLGPDATLLVGGDIFLSTADRLHFDNVEEFFDARGATTVLSAAVPSDFGFLVSDPATVGFYGSRLTLSPGKQLTAVGGTVEIVGSASVGASIEIESGRVQLAAVRGDPTDELRVPRDLTEFDARAYGPAELGDVNLGFSALRGDASAPSFLPEFDAGATLNVGSGFTVGTGGVVIRGGRFVMRGGHIDAVTQNFFGSEIVEPNIVDASLSDRITLEGGAQLLATTGSGVLTAAGDILLDAPTIEIRGSGTQVVTSTLGGLPGSDVHLTADAVSVEAGGVLKSLASSNGPGGTLNVTTGTLSVAGTSSQIATQNTGGGAGGAIVITAEDEVAVTGLGKIFSQATGAASAAGGDVSISVTSETGRVLVESIDTDTKNVSQISALTDSSNSGGTGGVLSVQAARVELLNGGQLRTTTTSTVANGGSLNVTQTGTLHISGTATVDELVNPVLVQSGIFALTTGSGTGGFVNIVAEVVEVDNGGRISASSQGPGDSSGLSVTATERLTVRGGPDGFSLLATETSGSGEGGDLEVVTALLELIDGGQLSASASSIGDSGNVTVTAHDVTISGSQGSNNPSGIFAQSVGGGVDAGDAGNIDISGFRLLEITDGARISVRSLEGGVAGDVHLFGGGQVVLSDGAVVSATVGNTRAAEFPGEDLTADIRIGGTEPGQAVESLRMHAARMTTETQGTGDGGDIDIRTTREVLLSGGATITARNFVPVPGSEDTVTGGGKAGSILIDAGRRFAAVSQSLLETRAVEASGGQISIAARELVYFSHSRVDSDVSVGGGDGGDFGIPVLLGTDPTGSRPPGFVVLNQSRVVTRAADEDGGNILIDAEEFLPSDELIREELLASARDSVLDATSLGGGDPGVVDVVAPSADVVGQIAPLRADYIDVSKLIRNRCEARRARSGSLVIQSRKAIEPPPDAPLSVSLGVETTPDAAAEAAEFGPCP